MAVARTSIEWTDSTWSPIRGCSRVSEGCRHCYAERMAIRQVTPRLFGDHVEPAAYAGLVRSTPAGPRWTGEVRLVESVLDLPLRWRQPRRIFVASMSDPHHERVPDAWRDQMLAIIALTPHHRYQWLTKRAEGMQVYFASPDTRERVNLAAARWWDGALRRRSRGWPSYRPRPWPLPNLHLGVSVEDQATAAERISWLLRTPAAVRWVSAEPLLGPLDLSSLVVRPPDVPPGAMRPVDPTVEINALAGSRITALGLEYEGGPRLDWVVVGGESGPGARSMDLMWARSLIAQCRTAAVPVFYKQGGASHRCSHDAKGGHWDCIPADLQIREFPRV